MIERLNPLTGLIEYWPEGGATGGTGPRGPIGPKGDRGDYVRGDQGPKGDKGDRGIMGPMGFPGERGTQGKAGKDGQDGAPGKDGQDARDNGTVHYVNKPGYPPKELGNDGDWAFNSAKEILLKTKGKWDFYYALSTGGNSSNIRTTSDLPEGTNLYLTPPRVAQYFSEQMLLENLTITVEDGLYTLHSNPPSPNLSQITTGDIGDGAIPFVLDGALEADESILMYDQESENLIIRGSYALRARTNISVTPGATPAIEVVNGVDGFATWIAGEAETISISGAHLAGDMLTLLIANDGTLGRNITFGTGFVSSGIVLGVISKKSCVDFVSDGTKFYEKSRTVGI